jgi:hypothetical protein
VPRTFDWGAPTRLARAFGALLGLPPPDLRSAQMGEAALSGCVGSALELGSLVSCVLPRAVPVRADRMRWKLRSLDVSWRRGIRSVLTGLLGEELDRSAVLSGVHLKDHFARSNPWKLFCVRGVVRA